jgi:hypothetical protein
MRVHRNLVPDGEAEPGVFRDHGNGMSSDWEKYSTPQQTRARAREPQENGVISLLTEEVRAIPGLTTLHSPSRKNRAHAEVVGRKTPRIRVLLSRIANWEIRLE